MAGDLIASITLCECVCVNGEKDQRLLQWQMAAIPSGRAVMSKTPVVQPICLCVYILCVYINVQISNLYICSLIILPNMQLFKQY